MFHAKLTSKRTGRVNWLRDDGTPTPYQAEAGRFASLVAAQEAFQDISRALISAVGRCAWDCEIVPAS